MYTLTHKETNGLQFIELSNPDCTSKATICLNQGGRLSDLMFNEIKLLADFDSSTYKDTYASSILFPFANRIKDGKYTFDGVDYVLDCNELDKNNALHGLVYDKTFECVDKELTTNYGSTTLQYEYDGTSKGFPFKFGILLTYKLMESDFSLSVQIINDDDKALPFTLGWHPYFISENLDKSTIGFKSSTKYLCDKQQIISGKTSLNMEMPYQLEGIKLDDGYKLQTNNIEFFTPEYRLNMTSTSKENHLQLYTPNTPNVIAIEPMTGAADSFNNKIGLQTLHPHERYNITWNIAFKNLKDKMKTNQLIT